MHTRPAVDEQPDTIQRTEVHQPPLTSPGIFSHSGAQFTSVAHPAEPQHSSPQGVGRDDDPFAHLPPTLTTSSTDASSSLPLTPATPYYPGRFSSRRSYQPRSPDHRDEDGPGYAGVFSNFRFAFRPPSGPVEEPPSLFGRYGLTASPSPAPSSNGIGFAEQWIPPSTYSSQICNGFQNPGLSAASPPGSLSEIPKGLNASVSRPVTRFTEAGEVCVHETIEEPTKGEDEDSPFAEVRASVSNTDDPDMPCLTFRMWFVGISLCLILSSANVFFYLRHPAPQWSGPVVLILAWFAGKLLEKTLPLRTWTVAGREFSLNPGPFNVKEHTLMYMLGALTLEAKAAPYAMAVTIVWEKRYYQALNTG